MTTYRLATALFLALIAWQARAEIRNLSQDWRFHAGEAYGAGRSAFYDVSCLRVALPHYL